MRETDNICAMGELEIDMIGLDFDPKSSGYIELITSQAGFLPDYSPEHRQELLEHKEQTHQTMRRASRVGIFTDDMVQNIVTRVYNHRLDYVQLEGAESVTTCENLRRTLDPDIRKNIQLIKTITIRQEEDFEQCATYRNAIDMFIFRPAISNDGQMAFGGTWLNRYTENIPFLLSETDISKLSDWVHISHPYFAGIDITINPTGSPHTTNTDALRAFIIKVHHIGNSFSTKILIQ